MSTVARRRGNSVTSARERHRGGARSHLETAPVGRCPGMSMIGSRSHVHPRGSGPVPRHTPALGGSPPRTGGRRADRGRATSRRTRRLKRPHRRSPVVLTNPGLDPRRSARVRARKPHRHRSRGRWSSGISQRGYALGVAADARSGRVPILGFSRVGISAAKIVVALALSVPGAAAVIDDLVGRKCALALGLEVMGTLGIVIAAHRRARSRIREDDSRAPSRGNVALGRRHRAGIEPCRNPGMSRLLCQRPVEAASAHALSVMIRRPELQRFIRRCCSDVRHPGSRR